MAVIYIAFAFNAAAATKILNKLGMRLTLCISGLSYSFFIGSFLVPLYKYEKIQQGVNEEDLVSDNFIKALLLISALVLGIGAGSLWVS